MNDECRMSNGEGIAKSEGPKRGIAIIIPASLFVIISLFVPCHLSQLSQLARDNDSAALILRAWKSLTFLPSRSA
jgi:hypothetical protein